MPADTRPWPRLMRQGLCKGQTFASQKEYDEARSKAKAKKAAAEAPQVKPKPIRPRKGESVQQSVQRALAANRERTEQAKAAHRAKAAASSKTAASRKKATARKRAAK